MTDLSKESLDALVTELRASRAVWEDGGSRPEDREERAADTIQALRQKLEATEADRQKLDAKAQELFEDNQALRLELEGARRRIADAIVLCLGYLPSESTSDTDSTDSEGRELDDAKTR